MSAFYISHNLSNGSHCRVYSYYREDLEKVYPKREIKTIEKIDKTVMFRFLPYILINEQEDFIQKARSIYCEKESWKDEYFKNSLDNEILIISPVSIEDLDYYYSDTIFFVYYKDPRGFARKIWCAHEEDLAIMFYGYEIFKTKYNVDFTFGFQNPLPYVIQDGIEKKIVLSGTKKNWKESYLNKNHTSTVLLIYPMSIDDYLRDEAEELDKIEKEWREGLGGKSVFQHLAEIVDRKELEDQDSDYSINDDETEERTDSESIG